MLQSWAPISLITENSVMKFKNVIVILQYYNVIKMLACSAECLKSYYWRKLVFIGSEPHLLLLILVPLKLVFFFCFGLDTAFRRPILDFCF